MLKASTGQLSASSVQNALGTHAKAATGTAFLLLFAIVISEAARETLTLGVQSSSPNAKQEYAWGKTLRTWSGKGV